MISNFCHRKERLLRGGLMSTCWSRTEYMPQCGHSSNGVWKLGEPWTKLRVEGWEIPNCKHSHSHLHTVHTTSCIIDNCSFSNYYNFYILFYTVCCSITMIIDSYYYNYNYTKIIHYKESFQFYSLYLHAWRDRAFPSLAVLIGSF